MSDALDALIKRYSSPGMIETPATTPGVSDLPEAQEKPEGLDDLIKRYSRPPPTQEEVAPGVQAAPETTVPTAPSSPMLEATPDAQPVTRRGFADVIGSAFGRGVAGIEAVPETLNAMYLQAQGDVAGSQAAAARAKAIESAAGDSYQKYEDISSVEDFLYWAGEKLGENIPQMGVTIAAGGAGGIVARLVGKGVLSSEAAKRLLSRVTKIGAGAGMFAGAAPMETADTAQEQFEATGQYHIPAAIAAGVTKGALEILTPLALSKIVVEGGTSIGKGFLKSGGLEAVTEGLQGETDIWARKYVDPKYNVWDNAAWLRRAEGISAGFVVGGTFGGVAAGAGKIGDRFKADERELTEDEIKALMSDSPVNWLWGKFAKKPSIVVDDVNFDPATGELLKWSGADISENTRAFANEQLEANTKRYAIVEENGLAVDRELYNATDVNTAIARRGNNREGIRIIEIAQGTLIPGNISATVTDLPKDFATSERVFFLEGVSPREQAEMRALLSEVIVAADTDIRWANARYMQLLNEGLRVLPTRGASFNYVGGFDGREVSDVPLDQRGDLVLDGRGGAFSATGKNNNFTSGLKAGVGVDLARLPEGVISYAPRASKETDLNDRLKYYADLVVLAPNATKSKEEVAQIVETLLQFDPEAFTTHVLQRYMDEGVFFKPFGSYHLSAAFKRGFDTKPYEVPAVSNVNLTDIDMWVSSVLSQKATVFNDRRIHIDMTGAANYDRSDLEAFRDKLRPAIQHAQELLDKLGVPQPGVRVARLTRPGGVGVLGTYNTNRHGIAFSLEYLGPQKQSTQNATVYHEFGHAVTLWWWNQLPTEIQQLVHNDYRRQMLSYALLRDGNNIGSGDTVTNDMYFTSFVEYLAEQFRRYGERKMVEGSVKDKALQQGANIIEKFYAEVEKREGKKAADNIGYPSRTFARWMNYLDMTVADDPFKVDTTLRKYMLSGGLGEPGSNYTIQEVREIIEEMIATDGKRILPAGVTVEFAENLPDGAVAVTYPDSYMIRLGAAVMRFGAKGSLAHEAIHILHKMNLFSPAEWEVLVATARADKDINGRVVDAYADMLHRAAAKLIRQGKLHPARKQAWVQDALSEEMVGELLRKHVNGQVYGSTVDRVMAAIIEFLENLYRRFVNAGYPNPKALMRAVWNGEVAARARQIEMEGVAKPKGLDSDIWDNRSEMREGAEAISFPNAKRMQEAKPFNIKEFTDFMAGRKTNAWIKVGSDLKVYVRKNRVNGAVTLASMETRNPGGGQLSAFLDQIEGQYDIEVEQILNGRLPAYLEQRGYTIKKMWGVPQAFRKAGPVKEMSAGLSKPGLEIPPVERLNRIKPQEVKQVGPDLWVAIEKSNEATGVASHFRFYAPPAQDVTGLSAENALLLLGDEYGSVRLTQYGAKGHEVDFVSVLPGHRRQGRASQFYAFVESNLNTKLHPSGVLLPKGYAFWQARDPSWLRYHVFSEADSMWYSPNYLIKQESMAERSGENPEFWAKLLEKVPQEAWNDPDLDGMWMSDKLSPMQTDFGMVMGAKATAEHNPGVVAQPMGFAESAQAKAEAGRAKNAKALGVEMDVAMEPQPELYMLKRVFGRGEENPSLRPQLYNVAAEADRISGFSKMFFSIVQIAQNNPNITELQNYKNIVDAMRTMRMAWIARADETVRAWDGLRPTEQRARLADMLFWATEMDYLSPQERANRVVRQPTLQEIQQYATQNRVSAEALAVYDRIKGDFDAFLTATEQVSIAHINQTFAANPLALQQALAALTAEMNVLRQRPYFPMTRFGKHTFTIRDANDRVVGFWAYATARERDSAAQQHIQLYRNRVPGMRAIVGTIPDEMMEFQGLPPGVLRMIKAQLPNATRQQLDWFDRLENQLAPEKSFRKRWLERKGTEGYSLDAIRAYSHYFINGSSYLARLQYREELNAQIVSLETGATRASNTRRGMLTSMMRKHYKYLMEGGKDYAKIKAAAALWFLAYSPMAALTNFSQIPMLTLPMLATHFGDVKAFAALKSMGIALRGTANGVWANSPWPGYEMGRQEMLAQGRIDAGQAIELGAFAEGSNLVSASAGTRAQKLLRDATYYGMKAFAMVERYNRELTYAMAFRLAMENPGNAYVQRIAIDQGLEIQRMLAQYPQLTMPEAIAIAVAKDVIDRSQFVYSQEYRPQFMHNPNISVALVFYQFTQSMLYTLFNDPAKMRVWFMLLATAGLMGLPGGEELNELVTMVARRFLGKDWDFKTEARRWIQAVTKDTLFEQTGADLMLHGLSRYGILGLLPESMGMPQVDMHGNLGMGKVSPGGIVGEIAKGLSTYSRPGEIGAKAGQSGAGAAGGVFLNMLGYLSGEPFTAGWKDKERLLQRQMKAMSKAYRYYSEGQETLRSGAPLVKFDVTDPNDLTTIMAQALGATPRAVTQAWEQRMAAEESMKFFQGWKTTLYTQMWKAVKDGDQTGIETVLGRFDRYNKEVKRKGYTALSIQGKQVVSSMKNRSRQEAMEGAGFGRNRLSVQPYKDTMELYPELIERRKVK